MHEFRNVEVAETTSCQPSKRREIDSTIGTTSRRTCRTTPKAVVLAIEVASGANASDGAAAKSRRTATLPTETIILLHKAFFLLENFVAARCRELSSSDDGRK
jgi:hypothetical protein